MRFASAVSQSEDPRSAARELIDGVRERIPDQPDLVMLFFTAAHCHTAAALSHELRAALAPGVFLGVSCEGVIGGGREIERLPGAAVLAGNLPGVQLQPFHLAMADWRTLLEDEERLQQRAGTGESHRAQLLLGDPFTTPVGELLEAMDGALSAPTIGGMASAAQRPGGNLLMLDGQQITEGAVGLGIGGPVAVETVVSQGCRPVGEPMVVTRVDESLVMELGRRPALEAAQEMLQRLPAEELELVQSGPLFVGVVIDEYQDRFERGDFLVRQLMGVHRETGGLAIGDHVRAGQTIQFHVRDAGSATEDLTELLKPQANRDSPAGGLLFSCNGRGSRMFDVPDHDVRTTLSLLPDLPLAGFFAMGELGPVGGKSFIHGHTASLALFRPLGIPV